MFRTGECNGFVHFVDAVVGNHCLESATHLYFRLGDVLHQYYRMLKNQAQNVYRFCNICIKLCSYSHYFAKTWSGVLVLSYLFKFFLHYVDVLGMCGFVFYGYSRLITQCSAGLF